MTLRPILAAFALLAPPALLVANVASAEPASESSTASAANRPSTLQRKVERPRPGVPLKPRVIEAPGAAVMMIPASYDPMQTGPVGPF